MKRMGKGSMTWRMVTRLLRAEGKEHPWAQVEGKEHQWVAVKRREDLLPVVVRNFGGTDWIL